MMKKHIKSVGDAPQGKIRMLALSSRGRFAAAAETSTRAKSAVSPDSAERSSLSSEPITFSLHA